MLVNNGTGGLATVPRQHQTAVGSQTYWRIAAFDLRLRIEYICASGIDDRLDRLLVEIELCLVRSRSERLRFIGGGTEVSDRRLSQPLHGRVRPWTVDEIPALTSSLVTVTR